MTATFRTPAGAFSEQTLLRNPFCLMFPPASQESMKADLRWLGLLWDEGPDTPKQEEVPSPLHGNQEVGRHSLV